jgi:hypothetical protein
MFPRTPCSRSTLLFAAVLVASFASGCAEGIEDPPAPEAPTGRIDPNQPDPEPTQPASAEVDPIVAQQAKYLKTDCGEFGSGSFGCGAEVRIIRPLTDRELLVDEQVEAEEN